MEKVKTEIKELEKNIIIVRNKIIGFSINNIQFPESLYVELKNIQTLKNSLENNIQILVLDDLKK